MKLFFTSIFSFFFLVQLTTGQDIHFSQFYASPLTLTPANTGNYDGDWRIMNNYRRQWGSFSSPPIPYTTISFGIDKSLYLRKDKLSFGFLILNDESSTAELAINKIFGSIAFHKILGNHSFNIGIQGGFVMKSVLPENLTFPNQFDNTTGYFNSDLSSGETTVGEQISYMDLNAGISWSGKLGNFVPDVGISLFHINQPKESFLDKDNKLSMRKVIHAGGKYYIQSRYFIYPNFLLMEHSKASDMLVGSNFGYILPSEVSKVKNIFMGVYFRDGISRNPDSFIGVVGANLFNVDLGISYDFNVSDLKVATNYKGGFEISLIYTVPSTKLTKITIPCDRF
ncbi:MAG: hypothetical protein A2W98_09745 [Bacteroidetes bacterium GWF2_33_38]|nr:MAG: hypothetical protein A2W98_09745 [Bacteroidetes bacterium GWF2_33_38]OFY75079.1 MAG: hypothetical protein A2265_06215 [Bacteroidetes bacterium RIFOXYA12_FULL_33_9]